MVVGIYFILEAIVNSGPLSDEHFYDRIDLQQPKIPSYRGLNPTVYSSLSVKYEDPQAADGLAGALDTRQQNTGAIPASQNNFMEDIEKWLSAETEEEIEGEDGVTSEEFDKFLEERAKAADRLPSVSSSTTDAPRAATSTGQSKKEKDEDAIFGL